MRTAKYYFRLFIAILGIGNLLLYFTSHPIEHLVFYTLQSNIIVSLWFALWVFYYKKDKKPIFLNGSFKGAITLYITITWLIYMTLLHLDLNWYDTIFSTIQHYIIPLAIVVDWLVFEEKKIVKYSNIPYWLIYPVCYLAFAVIRGLITGKYPYFFIDLSKNPLSIFFMWVAIILLLYILIGVGYVWYNVRKTKR